MEHRYIPMESMEIREDGEDLYLEGYFAVFNSSYELWPGATESVAPGAFDESISGDVRALYNHNTDIVLGRTSAGTMEIRQDSHGLWGSIRINQADTDAMNLYNRVKRGDVDQCSFGFFILAEERRVLENGDVQYVILKVRLVEVSVVTFPAYEETSVSARARQEEDIRRMAFAERKEKLREKLKGATKTC